MLQLFDLREFSLHLTNLIRYFLQMEKGWRRSSNVPFCELSPERDNEVNELPADPGSVPQWGVVVHPLPRDGDEGGVHVLITHLHQNSAEIAMLCQNKE